MLFFDLSSMQPEEVERAAKSAMEYADKQMAPADLVSVVTLSNSLKVDLDFTADKEALKTVMAGFDSGSNEGLGDGATPDPNADATDTSDAAAGFTADETEYNIFNTDRRLQALVSLANDLSVAPQKKIAIHASRNGSWRLRQSSANSGGNTRNQLWMKSIRALRSLASSA